MPLMVVKSDRSRRSTSASPGPWRAAAGSSSICDVARARRRTGCGAATVAARCGPVGEQLGVAERSRSTRATVRVVLGADQLEDSCARPGSASRAYCAATSMSARTERELARCRSSARKNGDSLVQLAHARRRPISATIALDARCRGRTSRACRGGSGSTRTPTGSRAGRRATGRALRDAGREPMRQLARPRWIGVAATA